MEPTLILLVVSSCAPVHGAAGANKCYSIDFVFHTRPYPHAHVRLLI